MALDQRTNISYLFGGAGWRRFLRRSLIRQSLRMFDCLRGTTRAVWRNSLSPNQRLRRATMAEQLFNDAERYLLGRWSDACLLEEQLDKVRNKFKELCQKSADAVREKHR